MKVKICGISNADDARLVAALKPDYMGFIIDFPKSVRSISLDNIKKTIEQVDSAKKVFLFVNAEISKIDQACHMIEPSVIQLHGDEPTTLVEQIKKDWVNMKVWKALKVPNTLEEKEVKTFLELSQKWADAGIDGFVLDSTVKGEYGGTGVKANWQFIEAIESQLAIPYFLAGGLKPETITLAKKQLNPIGLDVSSGVEKSPGIKDLEKVKQFITLTKKED